MKIKSIPKALWSRLRHTPRRLKILMFMTFVLWFGWSVLIHVPIDKEHYLQQPDSPQLLDRNGEPLYKFLNKDENWAFVIPLNEMSPLVINATMAYEDQRFRKHGGVDCFAIIRASLQNARKGEIVSGASTLTMQLVKMRDGSQRTLKSKILQAWRALRLENAATKDEILEAYLNIAPYGGNIVGIESASRRYFGKPAQELTLAEAATLAGIPQAPAYYHPIRHPEASKAKRNKVLRRMLDSKYISQELYDAAVNQELNAQRYTFLQEAPHLALALKKEINKKHTVHLQLDASLQAQLQQKVKAYVDTFGSDVTNAAVMVVDVQNVEVIARIGSGDFYHTVGGGQVDLCSRPRSPGSALKPFVYALAFEQGKLYPSELLLDDTVDYGRYRPKNFDAETSGRISATNALRESLNIPAVTILERIQTQSLWSLMKRLNFSTVHHGPDYYGLGMALGNCEVRLDELCAAYTMLANDGLYRPLRVRKDQASVKPKRLLEKDTVWIVEQLLKQHFPQDDLANLVSKHLESPVVAWKTGTSAGYRDAWAVGYTDEYVVGVWLGNNDGRGSTRLVGARAALPLLESIIEQLPRKASIASESYVPELQTVKLCPASGLPKSVACPKEHSTRLPKSLSLHRSCKVHRLNHSTQQLSTHWPGTADAWDLAKIPLTSTSRREAVALRIQSPVDKSEYVMTGVDNGDKIQLRSSLDQHTTVHWYQNDRYLGHTASGKPLLISLAPGKHSLSCWTAHSGLQKLSYSVVH